MADFGKIRDRMRKPQVETYNVGHFRSWIWQMLPTPVGAVINALSVVSVVGLAYLAGQYLDHGKGYEWTVRATLIMTAVLGVMALFKARKVRRDASGGATKSGRAGRSASASGIGKAAADYLEDLESKFKDGLHTMGEEFEMDHYTLPWYLMVGDTSVGKSEAILKCGLRFWRGGEKGVGGTQKMDWWFGGEAIILDTAGELFEEENSEGRFRELLRQLRLHRGDCPINGLILALPVDHLLGDTPEEAEAKAARIEAKLRFLQKNLRTQVPLYLLITKADLIPGFRDFCDAEGQDFYEKQMIGWSHDCDPKVPFEPAKILEALERVAYGVRKRVLALLYDPISRTRNDRLYEVARLYSLPHMLRSLGPRILPYLEMVYGGNHWSVNAPYFRGIYFTSACRIGPELDVAEAAARGLPNVKDLPPTLISNKEKTVYLLDTFKEKIFEESGLATGLKDRGLRIRQNMVMCILAALAPLIAAMVFTCVVKDSIEKQLDREQQDWLEANGSWSNGTLLSVLARKTGEQGVPRWIWTGDLSTGRSNAGKDLTRITRLEWMRELTQRPLHYAPVFGIWYRWREFEKRRTDAGTILIEAGAIKPVLDAAREKLLWDTLPNMPRDPKRESRLVAAYEQLALLEAWAAPAVSRGAQIPFADEKQWTVFFDRVLSYILNRDSAAQEAAPLAKLAAQIYGSESVLRSRGWLRDAPSQFGPCALTVAARFIFGEHVGTVVDADKRRAALEQDRKARLKDVTDAEQRALTMAQESPRPLRSAMMANFFTPMREAMAAEKGLLEKEKGVGSVLTFERVLAAAQVTLDVIRTAQPSSLPRPFEQDVERLLHIRQNNGAQSVTALDTEWNAASQRYSAYEKCFERISKEASAIASEVPLGRLGDKLQAAEKASVGHAASNAAAAPGPISNEAQICAFIEQYRDAAIYAAIFESYMAGMSSDLKLRLKFPLLNTPGEALTPDEFEASCEALTLIEQDKAKLGSLEIRDLKGPEQDKILKCFDSLRPVLKIKSNLFHSGKADSPGGLHIEVEPAEPPRTVMAPAVPVQAPVSNTAGGQSAAPPPAPQVLRKMGVESISVAVKEFVEPSRFSSPAQGTLVDYDGFSPVHITVVMGQTDTLERESHHFDEPHIWGLLRTMVDSGTDRFRISGTEIHFKVTPRLPVNEWPTWNKIYLPDSQKE